MKLPRLFRWRSNARPLVDGCGGVVMGGGRPRRPECEEIANLVRSARLAAEMPLVRVSEIERAIEAPSEVEVRDLWWAMSYEHSVQPIHDWLEAGRRARGMEAVR